MMCQVMSGSPGSRHDLLVLSPLLVGLRIIHEAALRAGLLLHRQLASHWPQRIYKLRIGF